MIGCGICRRREQQRRYANGLPHLPTLPKGVRASRLTLPSTSTERAYIAGLFDGEGSVVRARTGYYILQIGMTHQGVMEYLASMGGSMRTEQPPGNRQLLYRWRILARREVIEVLQALLPYLRVKRDLANAALDELLALERAA